MSLLRKTVLSGSRSSSRDNSPRNSPSIVRRQTNQEHHLGGYRIEDGSETSPLVDRNALMGNILLENPEIETRWYFKYFLGHHHKNWIAFLSSRDGMMEPVLLSMFSEEADDDLSVRAILWRKSGSERLLTRIPKGKMVDPRKIIAHFGHGPPDKKYMEVKEASVQDELLVIEEQEGAVNFKVGVLYGKKGQTTDDEMFSNESGSPEFECFYRELGNIHQQLGFSGFRAGLDVKNGSTGELMVHATEFGKEIVFHVSTLLPFSKDNRQQLERKRHLGNDICNIIFQEDPATEFQTDQYHSKYTHIFAVVSPLGDEKYSLKVYTKNTVPEYGPPLPNPAIFNSLAELRQFLIVKILNGEKATLSSPMSSFAQKKERTLEALILNIHEKYDRKRTMGRNQPKVKPRHQIEAFRSKGQSIKMSKIAEGTAPTSMRNMNIEQGLEPWTPVCITANLSASVVAGDAWGNDFVGSSAFGVSIFSVEKHSEGQLESRLLIDSSVAMVKITIDEESDMMYGLSASSVDDKYDTKNGLLYAIPLDALMHIEKPQNAKDLKKYIVSNSKGSQLFSIHAGATSTASILSKACKLVIAVGKKLRTYQFIPKNPARVPGMGTGGSFVQLQEYPCSDFIETVVLGEPTSGRSGQIACCALSNGDCALIDLDKGTDTPLDLHESALEVQPVMSLQVDDPIDSAMQEFVICYNQAVEFRHANGLNSRQYTVRWSSRPHAIAYVYPYLLGFTNNTIEVVTMINGSLVKTLSMSRCRFLCSKRGVYFTSTLNGQTMLYKMSEDALSGKTSVEDEMGGLQRQVAPGNIFVRRLSTSGARRAKSGGDNNALVSISPIAESPTPSPTPSPKASPRMSFRRSPKSSPSGSPSSSASNSPRGSRNKRGSSDGEAESPTRSSAGLALRMSMLNPNRKENPIFQER